MGYIFIPYNQKSFQENISLLKELNISIDRKADFFNFLK